MKYIKLYENYEGAEPLEEKPVETFSQDIIKNIIPTNRKIEVPDYPYGYSTKTTLFDRISKTIREDYDRELRLMHEHFTSEIDHSTQRLQHTIDGVAKHLKIDVETLREDHESFRHELYNELISRANDEKEEMLYS